jgi:hypothetical protein
MQVQGIFNRDEIINKYKMKVVLGAKKLTRISPELLTLRVWFI